MVGRQKKSRPFWACVGSRPWQLSALRDSAQRVSLRPRIDRRGFGRPSAPFPFALRLPQHGCKVTDERRTSTWSRIISDFSCSCSKTRERSLWARLATPESSRLPTIPATSGKLRAPAIPAPPPEAPDPGDPGGPGDRAPSSSDNPGYRALRASNPCYLVRF